MRLILIFACASLLSAQSYTISTYAGGAPPPTPVQATAVPLGLRPYGITVANGYVYLAADNTILQVDGSGVLTRLAGNGRTEGNGTAIPPAGTSLASLAVEFSWAQSVSVDSAGDLYVVDVLTYDGGGQPTYIWKRTPDGQMSIAAKIADGGNGVRVMTASPPSGALYVIDGGAVLRVASDGSLASAGSPALNASIDIATSIAFDGSGNLYVASSDYDQNGDFTNGRIWVMTPDGSVRPFAGTGVVGYSGDGGPAVSAQLGASCGVWVDGAGDVFISDPSNNALREVTPNGIITTVLQTGSAVAVDAAGNPYLFAANGTLVRHEYNGSLTPIAGGGSYIGDGGAATAATLNRPEGVAADAAHNIYIDDEEAALIRKITPDGVISTVAGNGQGRQVGDAALEGVPALTAPLLCPCQGLAADQSGNLFFTEWDRVRKVTPDGILTTVAATPALGLAYDGASLYIADSQESRVWKLAADGTLTPFAGNGTQGHSGDGGPALDAELQYPGDVAVDGSGNVYIAEYLTGWGGWIRKATPDGVISTLTLDRDLNGIAVDGAGNLYTVDFMKAKIQRIAPDGTTTAIAGVCVTVPSNSCWGYSGDGGPATAGQMSAPARIAVDTRGNLFVADSQNNAIRMITPQSSGH